VCGPAELDASGGEVPADDAGVVPRDPGTTAPTAGTSGGEQDEPDAGAGAAGMPAAGGATGGNDAAGSGGMDGSDAGSGGAGAGGTSGGSAQGGAGAGGEGGAGVGGSGGSGGSAGDGDPEPGDPYTRCTSDADCNLGLLCAINTQTGQSVGYCTALCDATNADACPQPTSGTVKGACLSFANICVLTSCQEAECPDGMRCEAGSPSAPLGPAANCQYGPRRGDG
jgi:hypothetical protein